MARRKYKTVRISEEAYNKVSGEAADNRRPFITQLDIALKIDESGAAKNEK